MLQVAVAEQIPGNSNFHFITIFHPRKNIKQQVFLMHKSDFLLLSSIIPLLKKQKFYSRFLLVLNCLFLYYLSPYVFCFASISINQIYLPQLLPLLYLYFFSFRPLSDCIQFIKCKVNRVQWFHVCLRIFTHLKVISFVIII